MPVRLKDIARELGLSVVTISKVLRNHPDIAEKTRDRVLKRIEELKYRPNLAARSLSTGRTCTAGIIVPDLLHPFFARIATTLSAELRKQGYGLIISSSEEEPELEQEEIEQLLARRVDVLLIASAQWTTESFRRIEEQKVPYVLLDRRFAGLDANFVGVDDQAVGAIATSHLIEQGCKRIAHIRGPEVSTAVGRVEGYRQALAVRNRVPMAGHIVPIGTSGDHRGESGGYESAKLLLANKVRPDGIFCFNDPIALGAMRAIIDSGLRIPEDVAVVGCGNLSYSDFLRVPLSSVDQNSQIIGERAAALALSLALSKKIMRPKSEIISPQLVIRASSQRIARSSA
jgi:LacI family transcriptional regulator